MSLNRLRKLAELGDRSAAAELRVEAERRGDSALLGVALLYGEPSEEAFSALCLWIDSRSEAEREAEAERVAQHIASWPDAVRVAPQRWLSRLVGRREAPEIQAVWPLVRAVNWPFSVFGSPNANALEALQALGPLNILRFRQGFLNANACGDLATTELLEGLHTLELPHAEDMGRILRSALTHSIHTLILDRCGVARDDLVALSETRGMQRLRVLELSGNALQGTHIWPLALWDGLHQLERLSLADNAIDDAALRTLLDAPQRPPRLDLDISGNPLTVRGFEALLQAGLNESLRHVRCNRFHDERMSSSPSPPRLLRWSTLSSCPTPRRPSPMRLLWRSRPHLTPRVCDV